MFAKLKSILLVKILIAIVSVFSILILIIWLILPGQLKSYIEKNDKSWINREVSIDKISMNPFTLNLNIKGVTVKEPNAEDNFIAFDNLTINFDFWALLESKINTQEVTITNLFGSVIQNGNQFNFSDLLKGGKEKTTEQKTKNKVNEPSDPILFNLRNINILKSSLHYIDRQLGSEIILDSIKIKDQVFKSTDSVFDADLAIHQPGGGWIKGAISYHLKNSNYNIKTQIEAWKLSPFKNYVTSVIRLSEFDGEINADIQLAGNVSKDYIKSNGQITVSDFKLIDPEQKPLITVGKFFVGINNIDNKANVYDFKEILVDNSKIAFEYLPNGNNFSKWLVSTNTTENKVVTEKENTSSDYYVSPFEMMSIYIFDMTKEYIFKSYTAEKIAFTDFNLRFYDHTLEDPFHMDLESMSIKAQNIKPDNQFAKFNIHGKMNSTALIDGDISVSRQGVENMEIDVSVKGLFLNRFSPYGREYTAHRFMEGISSFSNKSVIKDSYLTSTNTLHIENIKLSKKNKTRSGSSLPMRLAVALMKDSKGNIDLEIPIEGPINDPKYKFGKVVWQVVKNLFTKMITSPIKSLSNMFKIDEKDLKNIYFDNGQMGLSPDQKKPLNIIAKVLNKKTELKIELNHLYNIEYELDAIALKSAKLSYLKQSNLTLDESIPIGKQAFELSTSDPAFLMYLKKTTVNYDETISIPENARRLIGAEVLKEQLKSIMVKQKELVKNYLITEKGISENRFTIKDGATTEAALNQTRPKFEVTFGVVE